MTTESGQAEPLNRTVVTKLTKKIWNLRKCLMEMERVKGIEPSSQPWEGHILPLNHTRWRTDTAGAR